MVVLLVFILDGNRPSTSHTQPEWLPSRAPHGGDKGALIGAAGGDKGAGSMEDTARLPARGLHVLARGAGVRLRERLPSPLCLASLPASFTLQSRLRSASLMSS